jgi:erythromycin esterase-like protein
VVASSPKEFAEAVRAYRFEGVDLDHAAIDAAGGTLAESGLLLVGEPHGASETPAVLYALIAALGIRAVAFEWSHDELDGLVRPSRASGS